MITEVLLILHGLIFGVLYISPYFTLTYFNKQLWLYVAGEITLVAVGPLTNVALALRLDEKLGSKLKDFIVMGGNIHGKILVG